MVRGRRGRPAKPGSAVLGNGVQVASLMDDPHCASPKRKDCKIDTSLDKNLKIAAITMKHTASVSPPIICREKRTAAAAAAVFMRECLEAGHSKTRSHNIKNYFKANSKSDLCDIPRTTTNGIHHQQQDDHQLIAALSFDLSEEDTCTEIFGKYETQKPQIHHNHCLRSSPVSNIQNNIFLQEPVLSLNVDKSPNQASSIKIKKSLEVEPVFSSSPSIATYPICLNGQFNKIVSLNTSPKRENSIESTASTFASSTSNCYLLNIDNSSCDSGVAFIDNKSDISPSRRRKPATPHRILCPSPIKSSCVSRPGAMLASSCMSPAKKNHSSPAMSSLPPYQNNAQRRHPKSRRRLNQQEYENKCLLPSEEPQLQLVLSGSSEVSSSSSSSSADTVGPPIECNVSHTKSILNSAKNPTAEQNTNNNNKKTNNATLAANSKIRLQAANTNAVENRQLTEFFPVRRSVRKTKTAVKEEMMRSLEKAILEERAEGLKVIETFENKGRGIIADRPFQRGEFVVEYIGDLINMTEANLRERQYALDENAGCYMYYFKHKNQQYCIDATAESGKLGRLVNHSRNGNLITKIVVVKNRPHLVLIAKDDIEAGEELSYDYGDRSKEALLHHPWLAF